MKAYKAIYLLFKWCMIVLMSAVVSHSDVSTLSFNDDTTTPSPDVTSKMNLESKLVLLDEKFKLRLNQQVGFLHELINQQEQQIEDLRHVITLNWHHAPDGLRYKFFPLERTWEEAKKICQFYQGDIVMIENEKKNNFIKELLSSVIDFTVHSGVWTGMQTPAKTDFLQKFNNFSIQETFNGCIFMERDGRWKVHQCAKKHAFLCQT